MADELIFDSLTSAPIPPVAGLFDPAKVASVTCSINGHLNPMDQRGFTSVLPSLEAGRMTCNAHDGLNVDGGPDAEIDAGVIGRDWIMIQGSLFINHFFPNEESDFHGDVFRIALDQNPEQKVVVTGSDPQSVSWLFRELRPGLHEVDYGPWAVFNAVRHGSPGYSPGYHNICIQI